jgi:hypothetical protein
MLLTAFLAFQLAFDVAILLLFVVSVVRRRPTPAASLEPPAWYHEFQRLAQEVLAASEPLAERLEGERPAPPRAPDPEPAMPFEEALAAAPVPRPRTPDVLNRQREAVVLLRAGMDADEVARRGHLLPGELRLIMNVVAAENRAGAAPGA